MDEAVDPQPGQGEVSSSRRRGRVRGALIIVWLLLAGGLAGCQGDTGAAESGFDEAPGGPITVLAAASLSGPLTEAAELYTATTGVKVAVSYAASGTITAQIEHGAPADVVFLAGRQPMELLESKGLVAPFSVVPVLKNKLVVIVRERYQGDLRSLKDLTITGDQWIALADPAVAPAGQYAEAALRAAGVWDEVSPRILPALDVRAAAGAVAAGNAVAGIVYATDVRQVPGVKVAFEVPEDAHPPIDYPAAVVCQSDHKRAASGFVEWLRGPEAGLIFWTAGFVTNDAIIDPVIELGGRGDCPGR